MEQPIGNSLDSKILRLFFFLEVPPEIIGMESLRVKKSTKSKKIKLIWVSAGFMFIVVYNTMILYQLFLYKIFWCLTFVNHDKILR